MCRNQQELHGSGRNGELYMLWGAVGCRHSPRRRVRLRSPVHSLQPANPCSLQSTVGWRVRQQRKGTRLPARASCALPLAPAALGFPRFATLTAQEPRGLRAWLTSHPPPPPRSQLTAFHDLRSQKQERLTKGGRPKTVQALHQNSARPASLPPVGKNLPLVGEGIAYRVKVL